MRRGKSKRATLGGAGCLVAAVVLASACGGGDEQGAGTEPVVIELREQLDSGVSGQATLTATGQAKTRVVIEVEPRDAIHRPAGIRSGARCRFFGEILFDVADVVTGKSETTIDTSLDSLTDGNHIVTVQESQARAHDDPAACGAIARAT